MREKKPVSLEIIKKIIVLVMLLCWVGWSERLAVKVVKAQNLLKMADKKIKLGEYDEGQALSEEAKQLLLQIRLIMKTGRKLNGLNDLITASERMGAPRYAPEEYTKATGFSREAYDHIIEETLETAESKIREGSKWVDAAIEKTREYLEHQGKIGKLKQLDEAIAIGRQIGAPKHAPEEFEKAIDHAQSARDKIDGDAETYEEQIRLGIEWAEAAIEKTRKYLESLEEITLEVKGIDDKEIDDKDQYYIVRLIPKRRDCLWRIAAYEFIYNDPWKWKIIYEKNKDIISDPDLIHPGQKLVIPLFAQ